MRQIKLSPEAECSGLWWDDNIGFDNIDPATLGLSAALLDRLDRWTDRWDAQYDLRGRPAIEWAPGEFERFDQEGMDIWRGLQRELRGRYRVVYKSDLQGRLLTDADVTSTGPPAGTNTVEIIHATRKRASEARPRLRDQLRRWGAAQMIYENYQAVLEAARKALRM